MTQPSYEQSLRFRAGALRTEQARPSAPPSLPPLDPSDLDEVLQELEEEWTELDEMAAEEFEAHMPPELSYWGKPAQERMAIGQALDPMLVEVDGQQVLGPRWQALWAIDAAETLRMLRDQRDLRRRIENGS